MKLYPYVGPAHLIKQEYVDSPRFCVDNRASTFAWCGQQSERLADGSLTATFVVLPNGLWIAPRRSEHVACAGGGPVLAAGEITFTLDARRKTVVVSDVTNQSTGFCPEPESWPAVAARLDAAGIEHPGGYTFEIVFRRCPACGATNIVKDGWFVCSMCNTELPAKWNY